MYTATIEKCGDDYFIPLPQELVEALKLEEGELVEIRAVGESLIILKIR